MAKALRGWLPLVLHYVKPWLSQSDISAGERWSTKVAENLETTSYGIVCLTRENLQAQWILYEAGALGKFVASSAVCPYLLDLEFQDLTGPLAQYQAKKADEQSTLEIVESINSLAKDPIASDRLRELFAALWPKLENSLGKIPSPSDQPE